MPVSQMDHPDLDRLTAFGLGLLAEADSAEIELHLSECAACCEKLEYLPADSLVDLLQASEADTPSDLSHAIQTVDSGLPAPAPASLPPLYKKLANIVGGKPAGQAVQSSLAKVAAFHSHKIPNELQGHSRYEVLEPLGSGGMGAVYKAKHRLMDRMVALKIVNPLLVTKPGAVERFIREVKAAAQLTHPNIVTAYDAEQIGEMHVLVMEYVEGETLGELLNEQGVLGVTQACDYVRQTALGLQHAVDCGMVHRDIKPLNLMLTKQRAVKILDFGLARFVSEQRSLEGSTEHGSMMGSPDYMAPEQARDAHTADARADIYSLGCTLYQLLAGQVPFPGKALLEKLEAHRDQQPPDLNQIRVDVPADLERIIAKMMAKDPAQRFQSPAEVAEALLPFTKAQPISHTAVAKPPKPAIKRKPSVPMVMAVVAALLLAAIGYWAAQVVFRVETSEGTLIVETDDPDVQISVKSGGKEVALFFPKEKKEVPLQIGEYTIELVNGKDGLKLSTNKLEIKSDSDEKTVTVEFVPAQPRSKVARQLKDVVDLSKAIELVSDDFDDPKKSVFGSGHFAEAFADGRIIYKGSNWGCWGDSVQGTDVDLVCELTGCILTPQGRSWGIAIYSPAQKEEKLPTRGAEVVIDDNGKLLIDTSRWVEDESMKIPSIGPIQVMKFNAWPEQNSLTVIIRKGRMLEIFVNGVEACDPVELHQRLSPAHLQLLVKESDKGSVLAFERFKVWSLLSELALPSVEELLRTPELLTVAQDGSGDFKTIQAALDKVQANGGILIKGKGPYRETPTHSALPANVSLISLEGARVEVDKYFAGHNAGDGWQWGAFLNCQGSFRMSGLTWVSSAVPKDFAVTLLNLGGAGPGDIIVEKCSFEGQLPGMSIGLRCWSGLEAQQKILVEDNHFSCRIQVHQEHGNAIIQRNWFDTTRIRSDLSACQSGSITFRDNVVQVDEGIGFFFQPQDKAKPQPGVDLRVHNNVFETTFGPIEFWSNSPDDLMPRSVNISNNIMRSRNAQGVLLYPETKKKVSDTWRWRIGPNAYSVLPKDGPFWPAGPVGVSWPTGEKDLVIDRHFLSVDPHDPNYLHIAPDGPLATGGAGGDLPTHFGAFPPGPAPKDGDWFTRMQEVAKRAEAQQPVHAPLAWPADALREGRITAPDLSKANVLYKEEFDDPKSGWPQGKYDNGSYNCTRGYEMGRYFIQQNTSGSFGWHQNAEERVDFACQIEGRVTESSSAFWTLGLSNDERRLALMFKLNGQGSLVIAVQDYEKEERTPPLFSGTHPAITLGLEFNTLTVFLRSGRLEVYVNGIAVCDPLMLDVRIEPVIVGVGVSGEKGRAEFEQITVWSAEGVPTPEERLAKGEVPVKNAAVP